MTTHTHAIHYPSARNAAMALAAAALAVGGAYGITVWTGDDGSVTAPGPEQSQVIDPASVRDPSLERLMPAAPRVEKGDRGSQTSGGLTDQKLNQLR